jgi:peroxiredoxin
MEADMRIAIIFTLIMSALSFGEEPSKVGKSRKLSPLPQELQGSEIPSFFILAPNNETRLYEEDMAEQAKKLGAKRLVISFFATWCENCVEEFALLKKNYGKLKEKGVLVYLVNAGEDLINDGKKVSNFVEKYAGNSFPFYYDQKVNLLTSFGILANKNEVGSLPVVVVMDANLRVLSVFTELGNDFPQVLWGDL